MDLQKASESRNGQDYNIVRSSTEIVIPTAWSVQQLATINRADFFAFVNSNQWQQVHCEDIENAAVHSLMKRGSFDACQQRDVMSSASLLKYSFKLHCEAAQFEFIVTTVL